MLDSLGITDLAARVVETARVQDAKIITAESCTAGALATLLADTPGAGDILLGGFVTYAKACKSDVLGIPRDLLDTYSAVSAVVAKEMAQAALDRCASANISVAATCVGGPEPDEDGNPVGLTFLSVQRRGAPAVVCKAMIDEKTSGRVRGEVLSRVLILLLDQLGERRVRSSNDRWP